MNLNENALAVTARLQSGDEIWTATPNYLRFDQAEMHQKFDEIAQAVKQEGYGDWSEVDQALDKTQEFTQRAFELYDGRRAPDHEYYRAFTIPTHNERGVEQYSEGNLAFAPLLNPKFGLTSEIWQRALVGFPPTILDTYTKGNSPERVGALVYAPLFLDMMNDIVADPSDASQWVKAAETLKFILNDTADFAYKRLGSKVMGLGAIIPVLSNFGNDINQEGLETTTGHAGTVYLILETIKSLEQDGITELESKKIGVIGGAGSIGYSVMDSLITANSKTRIHSYDKNLEKLGSLSARYENGNLQVESSSLDVLKASDVIVAAISGRIDLDDIDPRKELDLSGKIIIDDSQPGCFDKEQVEARNGRLIWVVGKDGSRDGFMESDTGYSFGGKDHGLYDKGIWGCQAEVAVLAASGELDSAIKERVTPEHVRRIAQLCLQENVQIAQYQAYGKPVHLG